jgi:hypothetical protein
LSNKSPSGAIHQALSDQSETGKILQAMAAEFNDCGLIDFHKHSHCEARTGRGIAEEFLFRYSMNKGGCYET